MNKRFFLSTILLSFTFVSCTPMSSWTPPIAGVPKTDFKLRDLPRWWEEFGDQALNAMVREALKNNSDVLLAGARVEEARAAVRLARSGFFPSLNLTGDARRTQNSQVGSQPLSAGQPLIDNSYSLGFEASYEIDLWGRLKSIREGARANLAATAYAQEVSRTAVAAQTARSYFTLLALDAEEELLMQTLETRDRVVEIQRKRLDAGLIDAYTFALVEAERNTIAALLPLTIAAGDRMEIALANLLGRSPRDIMTKAVPRGEDDGNARLPEVPAGLPSNLLLRRPDVLAAEQIMIAANANVKESRARWFPRIDLTGFLGGESASLSDLLEHEAKTWNIGPTLLQPIIGLGFLKADTDRFKSRREQAEIAYQAAARQAYTDAWSALASHRGARDGMRAARRLLANRTKVKELAEQQYEAGRIGRLDILDAERERLAAERYLLSSMRDRLIAVTDVLQALGGGWNVGER